MIFYISKDARTLFDAYDCARLPIETVSAYPQPEHNAVMWAAAFTCEQLTMRFDPRSLLSMCPTLPEAMRYVAERPTRADALEFDLLPYKDAYLYICSRYLVADYGRVDALKLAMIGHDYPLNVIEAVATRCRHAGNFTIPYLAASLQNEGAKEIDRIRHEQELNELVASSSAPPLPPGKFPGKFAAALERAEVQEQIKSTYRGRR